ncbi:UbiA-like protein EboC [Leptospira sp. WS60.C2]
MNLKSYLTLLRPSNLLTAIADILAGMAIVGFPWKENGIFLILSSVCLYGGGVVLNDYFDRDIDSRERPERPIPSGNVSPRFAVFMATSLLCLGVLLASFYGKESFFVSGTIVIFIFLYDRFAKHHQILGPLVMGFCRGFNLILGMTILGSVPVNFIFIAILPILYIAAITLISQNEVVGGGKTKFVLSGFLYGMVLLIQSTLAFYKGQFLFAIPFLCLHGALLFPPLWNAYLEPSPVRIGKAVKMGVISLIVFNASFAAAFGFLILALCILLLLPLSLSIAKYFAVT